MEGIRGERSNEVARGAPKDTVRTNPQGGGLGGSMVTSREVGVVEHSNEMVCWNTQGGGPPPIIRPEGGIKEGV